MSERRSASPAPIHVHLRGAISRHELARLLYAVCLELGRGTRPRGVIVTTAELDSVYAGATIDLLAWLVVYSRQLGRVAIVSESGACFYRVTQLAMQSGHRMRAFWGRESAMAWLAGAPSLPEASRVRACA